MIRFDVLGTPAPKGSSRAIMRGGFAVNVPSGSDTNKRNLRTWDQAVRLAAQIAAGACGYPPDRPAFIDVALRVNVTFRMKRPKGHWGKNGLNAKAKREPYPKTKPDQDKLLRATLDAMEGLLFDDDGRISESYVCRVWAAPGEEGASIIVEPIDYQPPPTPEESGPILPGFGE